ncbi:MAG: hypothetical protein A3G35_11740 [candidate division NC10 bacterium RIFCSPLOWO2_12_FULL_66_18]|nr:MAG: hypothetical protein A3H39_19510 [candidate division NC10 bacterium RIFCSPLOWO2_02_FULL_66_22]OGB97730.1 MAG: hypothetical protein A3G35_11740 [candidate division NC10 bacterium RIFCSPLOWO2_12_FULL_66_18]
MSERVQPYRVGVDIGGTFTDLVLLNNQSGALAVEKLLTTPDDPARAVQDGTRRLLERTGTRPESIADIIHATTLVSNALIERKGAKTALLVTAGFRDVLQCARESRYNVYDLALEVPEPVVPRHRTFEIPERILATGEVRVPPDEGAVRRLARRLRRERYEAVAVCLLHAYRNPDHERRVAALLRTEAPDLFISLSSEVLAQAREFERACLTAMNAFVQPVVKGYLARLEADLAALGFRGSYYMGSQGGILTPEAAAQFPVRLLESGPAAGALAAALYGRLIGCPDLLSFDMGGTTAKACLVRGGAPLITTDFEVARVKRFMRGSGLPVRLPIVDMIEIGAGGGSLARADALGLLSVGPESAGADPGPVCYGRGGTEPTVTDADLLLGYLNAAYFLGGEMALDAAGAETALGDLGARLGLSAVRAAWGIHEVVTANMAEALRVHAVEKGVNYRGMTMVAFGGAGPVHAYRIARILGLARVIFPRAVGAFSALGLLSARLAFDLSTSYVTDLASADMDRVHDLYRDMFGQLEPLFTKAGVAWNLVERRISVDMRYKRQGFEVTVPVPEVYLEDGNRAALAEAFDAVYQASYGRLVAGAPVEAVTWRAAALAPPPRFNLRMETGAATGDAIKGSRPVYLREDQGSVEVPVLDRYRLQPGVRIEGPVILEERESTIYIGPGAWATLDELGGVVMTLCEVS